MQGSRVMNCSIYSLPPQGLANLVPVINLHNEKMIDVQVFFSGTPLKAPFSSKTIKTILYKLTGIELHDSVIRRLKPGRATHLLPEADLPDELRI